MPIKPLIFILNGPKDSGKDFLCDELTGDFNNDDWESFDNAVHLMFKQPLYDISSAIAGMTYGEFVDCATDRTLKEKPMDKLGGRSPREFMIYVSEEVIKPSFGKDYFGQRLADEVYEITSDIESMSVVPPKHVFFTVSDGGFSKEIIPLVERFGVDSVKVIHLKRDGRDFKGDSRRYIYPSDFSDEVCPNFFTELYNEEGNKEKAVDDLKKIMQTCLADYNSSQTLKELSNED